MQETHPKRFGDLGLGDQVLDLSRALFKSGFTMNAHSFGPRSAGRTH